jgi:acetylornithine deacetylase/succinyl-diaminopimelate desuccinylase-like protein
MVAAMGQDQGMANPAGEVVQFTSELIRIDTSNPGPGHQGPGERAAAEYVATKLDEVGITSEVYESAPRRTTIVAHWEPEGCDRSLPPLLLHGHTDVVPAVAADWAVDPFSGAVRDGYVWGRGAVDMKDFDAMLLSVIRDRVRQGRPPRRPIRLIFTADEECGGVQGAEWLVRHHPDTMADCAAAVGEVGGFSVSVGDDARLYLLQTAEKGLAWLKLIAEGTAGHGSMLNHDNAVTELAGAIARLGSHTWPVELHPAQQAFLDAVSEALGVELTADTVEATLTRLGSISRMTMATMTHTLNPSVLEAGYKVNVIPRQATAEVDGRFLPGRRDEFMDKVKELIGPKVRLEILHEQPSVESALSGALVDAMTTSLRRHDEGARVTPFLLSAGTDGKCWNSLGVACYGFTPLRLPADLDFAGLFHGVDERVPVDALEFGCRVLDDFLDLA